MKFYSKYGIKTANLGNGKARGGNKCVVALMLFALVIGAALQKTFAFSVDSYRQQSVLSQGKWVKISVPESGLYAITPAQLRQWGFSDASKIRICGYGGAPINDLLNKANYVDDLPVVQSYVTSGGNVVFYGVGPETWTSSVSGRFSATSNIYTTKGYYFVTQAESSDSTLVVPEITRTGIAEARDPYDYFWDRQQYEKDITSPGQAGPQLVGEDFRLTPSREFRFDLTDRIDNDEMGIWFETSFVAKTYNQSSTLTFTANGKQLEQLSTDRIAATVNDLHYHGTEGVTRHTVPDIQGNTFNLRIAHSSPVTVQGAWLNYIAVNYQRKLQLDSKGQLRFWSNNLALSLGNASESTRVFDVTDPTNITELNVSALTPQGRRVWSSSYVGWRTYAALNDNATLPAPDFEETLGNQNLHGRVFQHEVPDMVILCTPQFYTQARRIADLHANDPVEPLNVDVVDISQVYNEFSSGMAHVSGIRKYFKLLWDKGVAEAPDGYESKFRYAILMGRTSYDSRLLTDDAKAFVSFVIPTWMGGTMRQSLNDSDGYGTDDFMAMLRDNSGTDKGLDDLCIAIGRLPVRTAAEAELYVDKLEQYMNASRKTGWKTSVMFLADDGDTGKHLEQSENFVNNMAKIADNPLLAHKVYMDAYIRENGSYPAARDEMFRLLNEGVVWWTFIGHANDHSLTHNSQLTYNDLNNLYYKNVPVFYGATCDFLRWDQNSVSGGELMLLERYGGAITVISATRPVYIYENGLLSAAFGRQLGARDAQGRLLSVGEIYRRAKNNILTDAGSHLSNTNRLKYVFMGDPAMRLATPSNLAEITEIDGVAIANANDDNPVELHALQNATLKGVVRNPDGDVLADFNGVAVVTLLDAEYSTTTNGYDDAGTSGKVITFEQQGKRLAAASAPVVNGQFEMRLSVPVDISDNYRPAAITTYAYATDSKNEAAGFTNKLYVYGFDENAPVDDTAPVIESMYLNHASFRDGDTVDKSPMLIATVSDDVAINLSTAGIGHSMVLQLDERKMYNDVSLYFTPAPDGSNGGTINYPLSDLNTGEHSLMLRVWDTSANSTTQTINFKVQQNVAPKIYDIYCDANPAHDKASFYLVHDRPDQMATVTIEVFNMLGHSVWTKTVTGVSDMFTSTPVTWNLTDMTGRRVQRGIYLYRATITVDGETFDTGSRRLAVAAQ